MPTALVTGATSGIGLEYAKILAHEKYDLILVARNLDKLNQLQTLFKTQYPIDVHVLPGDLSQPDIPEKIFEEINHRHLTVDVLINNAGFGYGGFYKDQSWDNEQQMIQVNITSLAHLTKIFLKGMLERNNGKIVNVASTAAFVPGPMMAVYYATKSYVLHFSEALANEVKGTGVTVTCLCPGATATEFQSRANVGDSKLFKGRVLATPEKVARYGYKAMMKGKTVAIYGWYNKFLYLGSVFLTRNMKLKVIRRINSG